VSPSPSSSFPRTREPSQLRLATLDAALARGLADAEAGCTTPAAEVFDRLEAKYRSAG
jgi:antitoxin ParD1/3/4